MTNHRRCPSSDVLATGKREMESNYRQVILIFEIIEFISLILCNFLCVMLQIGNEPQLRLDGRCARDRRRGAGKIRLEGEDEGLRHRGRGQRRLGTG